MAVWPSFLTKRCAAQRSKLGFPRSQYTPLWGPGGSRRCQDQRSVSGCSRVKDQLSSKTGGQKEETDG